MVIAIAPFIIALVGLLLWLLTAKASEVGRIMFACGMLVLTYVLSKDTVHVGSVAVAIWPVVIIAIGLVLWFATTNPMAAAIGKIMFACGMLVLTFVLANETVHIGSGPARGLLDTVKTSQLV